MNESYDQEWKKYIKKLRLRKLIFLPPNTSAFLQGMELIEIKKRSEERIANFGDKILPYIIERWEITFTYENERYLFYKLKNKNGHAITYHWAYETESKKRDVYLTLSEEEKKEIKEILQEFPFEKWM